MTNVLTLTIALSLSTKQVVKVIAISNVVDEKPSGPTQEVSSLAFFVSSNLNGTPLPTTRGACGTTGTRAEVSLGGGGGSI